MTKDMTTGSPMRLIFGFAVPMLFGMLFQQFYNLVDTMIVGRTLGIDALAGVGATGCLNFMIIGFCMGVSSGFAIPVAQQFGAGNERELRKFVYHSYLCSAAFAAVITVLSVAGCRSILLLLGTPESIFPYAYQYIVVIFLGIPTIFLYNMVSGIIRSLGDSKTPVVFLVIAASLNILLDFVFILGLHFGVAGAALATVVSQLLAGIGCFLYMNRKFEILKGHGESKKLDRNCVWKLCVNGVPMGLQYSITAIGSVILQAAVNSLGAMYVAAMTAGGKMFNFTTCPFDALGSTMATYGGQNVGAGKITRVRKGLGAAVILGTIYSIGILIFLHFFTKQIATLFVDPTETQIIAYTYQYIIMSALFFIPLTLVNVVRFCIQGMGYSGFAMIAGILEMIARSFAALILVPIWGYQGACLAGPFAWIAADAFLIPAFFWCEKKLNCMIKLKDRNGD